MYFNRFIKKSLHSKVIQVKLTNKLTFLRSYCPFHLDCLYFFLTSMFDESLRFPSNSLYFCYQCKKSHFFYYLFIAILPHIEVIFIATNWICFLWFLSLWRFHCEDRFIHIVFWFDSFSFIFISNLFFFCFGCSLELLLLLFSWEDLINSQLECII